MEIVTKEKKDITWRGAPMQHESDREMARQRAEDARQQREQSKEELRETLLHIVSLRNLVAWNRRRGIVPPGQPDSPAVVHETHVIDFRVNRL